ncbi:glycoside hydrolase family 99-like domain-containing protein, partial [Phenylobacterium sp.]|uniref:glycoside hydrolase family 99-like domain-containing protein n=1 Tax=Phenylobacterium sp. TaxID=1871053 RepID=UPI0011FED7F0
RHLGRRLSLAPVAAKPIDPAALVAVRRAAHEARTAAGERRWARFQAANRARYAGLAARRTPPGLARLLARAKTPGRVMLLQASGLWEPDLEISLGSTPGPTVSLNAYVQAGPDPAAQPRALFDQSWYLGTAPALAGSRWAPLAHYLVVGDGHNLSPHPLLDGPAYRARHGARMAAGRLTALEHFLFEGAAAGANPHPLFDVRHYIGQSDEVAETGENPLIHYLRAGWREGLEPHPLFAGDWYLERNPEAQAAGVAPLLDYATKGAAEGLDPHPLFETAFYRRQRHGGLRGEPLSDYLRTGARGGKSPSPHFKPTYYLEQAGGQPLAHANPLQHYLTIGAFAGLWPAPDFDESAYFAAHPDAAESPLSGLEHWLRLRTERPATGAPMGHAVSAQTLFGDLRRASDPDPQAYGVADYEALRRPRTVTPPSAPVRMIALRRTRAPDWVAVARALPNYLGHLQPRLPAHGFSDPTDPAVLAQDEALAARYGLTGFCHEAANTADLVAIAGAAFPFCLAWTGKTPPKAVSPLLASAHALRVDGRPIVLLSAGADLSAWRQLGELFLIQRGGQPAAGFDARLPDPLTSRAAEGPTGPVINPDFRGLAHDAMTLVADRMAEALDDDEIPLVVAAHDTTPTSQDAPVIWQGASPGALQAWLESASDAVRGRDTDRRLVFVHAWNDWEGGAVLEPDLRFGHGWLEAAANAADTDLLT